MPNQMLIRIETNVKERFTKIARAEGKTASQKVRELIEEYVTDRDIGPYIDDLWGRIGKKLKGKKRRRPDVGRAVKAARGSR